ncbi:MAG: carbon starvation protein A [bacterium]|nr:carbon starvation protein A [bacterium]
MVLLFGGIAFLFLFGYGIYARYLEKRIIKPDASAKTPAFLKQDGLDYIPAQTPLLWGHHFSNIAGAGPILGPLVAVAAFGWAPTLLWVLLGCVFCGAVHDYVVLSASMKNGGASIATVAQKTLGRRAKIILSIFLLLSLILIVAVFAVTSAITVVQKPELVIPTFGIIPLALLLGYSVYKLKINLLIVSVIAIGLMILLVYLGFILPVSYSDGFMGLKSSQFWVLIFFLYGLSASILPVGYLDQPRDYISTAILFLGMFLGLVSLVVANPPMQAPAFVSLNSAKEGPLWPMLFVLVACGAISGFHALVSGGTTAKQLRNEKYQKVVGYGAMLAEGVVAIMSALLVAAGLYWGAAANTEQVSYNLITLLDSKGWIVAFGTAYGRVASEAFGFIPFAVGSVFAMLMLNTFVLTTLDTAVRLGRYIVQESAGERWRLFKSRTLTSFIVIVPALILAFSNTWQAIWPIFGAANQLIAALALIVVTTYLFYIKAPTKFTLIPGIFLALTTIAALLYKMYEYLFAEEPKYLLGITAIILVALAVLVVIEAVGCLKKIAGGKCEELPCEQPRK